MMGEVERLSWLVIFFFFLSSLSLVCLKEFIMTFISSGSCDVFLFVFSFFLD